MIKEITHTHHPLVFKSQGGTLSKCITEIIYYGNESENQAPRIFDFEPASSVMILFEMEMGSKDATSGKARILGPHLNHVPHFLPANARMWAVLFRNTAWYHLTAMTVFSLLDRCLPVSEHFGEEELSALMKKLHQPEQDVEASATAIDQYLQTQFGKSKGKRKPAFQQAINTMESSLGFSRVEDFLTEKIKIRSLERYCRNALGIPPKSFLELLRYHHILRSMHKNQDVSWNDLVFKGFYSDEAHFQRDFKRLSKPGVLKGCESLHI